MTKLRLLILPAVLTVLATGCIEQASQPPPRTAPQPMPAAVAPPAPAPMQPTAPPQQQKNLIQQRGGVADDGV